MEKKVIILEHDGGELANQLWNYASIYAYALEKKFACENWSFFTYAQYFKNLYPTNKFIRTVFFKPFAGYHKRRGARRARFFRKLYKALVTIPVKAFSKRVFSSANPTNATVYLPPTKESPTRLYALEADMKHVYMAQVSGAVFRNPVGMQRYRKEILEHFRAAPGIEKTVTEELQKLRVAYAVVVGVHVRQGDYKNFKGGKFRIRQARVREILEEYLMEQGLSPEHVCFLIASDSPIEKDLFVGLNIVVGQRSAGEDLFFLSACDAVIGSDSTFGHFAAYLGNVPHIVMKNEPIDWAFYRGKKTFEHHQYLTVMAY